MELIRTPADLRPGDIFFGPISGPVGLGTKLGHLWLRERFRVGPFGADHVAIVSRGTRCNATDVCVGACDPPRLIQAMPSGAEEVDFSWEDHWTERTAYVRLPELYPGQAEDAARIAHLMVELGVSYSFASYAALAAWRWGLKTPRLEAWIDRRRPPVTFTGRHSPMGDTYTTEVRLPVEAICSVLVDQAWSLAGQRVMDGVARQAVTPGAMAGQLWRRPGATWALPVGTCQGGQEAGSWVVSG